MFNRILKPGSTINIPRNTPSICSILHKARTLSGNLAVIFALGVKPERKNIPVNVNIQNISTPYGVVLRLILTLFDNPANPLKIEVLANVMDEETRRILKLIYDGPQKWLPIIFLEKIDVDKAIITDIMCISVSKKLKRALKIHVELAVEENSRIENYNFMKAKKFVIERIPL